MFDMLQIKPQNHKSSNIHFLKLQSRKRNFISRLHANLNNFQLLSGTSFLSLATLATEACFGEKSKNKISNLKLKVKSQIERVGLYFCILFELSNKIINKH